ncbi:hypothetical protein SDRG_04264 [Saprolegnia diclina VS20]|uniref:Uncharacterized protein n=1 Tax=Saprolegnia diclina (strain VS20) TaxID=1156394 RepID=T0QKL5_SAPDV|nr:hypothetical protein SDRG_04264 [Saprolegnia diclina VS20]EQC38559.1 hypothetical protein SDRG_04264 [Saprolegnia diclina VS20]|eukprot:XP_008608151.1 hypothetical protein SDRG_04264 [Saprolegnia diclina VS20]
MQFYRTAPEDLLRLLEQHGKDVVAVQRVLAELHRCIRDDATSRERMAQCHVVSRLAAHIELHATQPGFLLQLSILLDALVIYDEHSTAELQSAIVRHGLWRLVLRGMQATAVDDELQAHGCALTSTLCYDYPRAPHDENQVEMVQSGALEAIRTLLVAESTPLATYLCGVRAIGDLCYKNGTWGRDVLLKLLLCTVANTEIVLKISLFPLLSHGLDEHAKHAAVLEAIARVFFVCLVAHPHPSKRGILQCSVLERALHCLHSRDLLVSTAYSILRLLETTLRDDEAAKDLLTQLDGANVIINAVEQLSDKYHDSIGHLVFLAAAIFSSMSLHVPAGGRPAPQATRIQGLMQHGAHTFAVSSLTSFPTETFVLEQCLCLMERLMISNHYRLMLVRAGAVRNVRYIYNTKQKQHEGLLELCERVMSTLDKETST